MILRSRNTPIASALPFQTERTPMRLIRPSDPHRVGEPGAGGPLPLASKCASAEVETNRSRSHRDISGRSLLRAPLFEPLQLLPRLSLLLGGGGLLGT